MSSGPVTGEDGIARCPWGATPGVMQDYHDTEWGMPVSGDTAIFERLTLEAFQSGLSWSTILNKRDNFRAAFDGFDPEIVAAYGADKVAALMADAGIVRNRLKVDATIVNARALLALDGSLEELVRAFAPAVQPAPRTTGELPGRSPESLALSKALKKQGFTFVGPTTMYALMEAIGIVDTHLVGCHRRGAGTMAG
ncbi:DNA-3-methyladenine glycosylase I [Nocardioides ginsengisegetis]|uniref:DNA-3-methyladenine glycosylase I n=1 Tax=Nocardioides ginsengisegetis TaxID=661491 RepID=A0A7W3PB24_9ACTN|nr:DNA-3-methyladenine glycosylase I [Nocardioides ginsengisegetis]MBA8805092.1 DNA-3-methyladenine glycosylase I [Nocardioides ginsengisegetis]